MERRRPQDHGVGQEAAGAPGHRRWPRRAPRATPRHAPAVLPATAAPSWATLAELAAIRPRARRAAEPREAGGPRSPWTGLGGSPAPPSARSAWAGGDFGSPRADSREGPEVRLGLRPPEEDGDGGGPGGRDPGAWRSARASGSIISSV